MSVSTGMPEPNQFSPLNGDQQRFLGTNQGGNQTARKFVCLLFPVGEQSPEAFHLEYLDLSLCIGFAALQQDGSNQVLV